jgi:tetraacyldisaccharide 4'-kinase
MIERIWFGDSGIDRAARAVLSPLELLYRGVTGIRGTLYDLGIVPSAKSSIPVVSIGNVTVGGTGKTPIAAFLASELSRRGLMPAIVMRGYGGDEPRVHARINPKVPVIVSSDRVQGIDEARRTGANIAVLDDAFQHRRAGRDVDLVLISADSWTGHHRTLPAGPYREPLSAISRATGVIITRKFASDETVSEVMSAVARLAPGKPVIVALLSHADLIRETGIRTVSDVADIAGKSVLAIAAVGNPHVFFDQLDCAGGRITRRAFPDHHRFDRAEAEQLAKEAANHDFAICTLKDAVKLGPLWPAPAKPLWYVSLAVTIERNRDQLDRILDSLSKPHGD